MSPLPRITRDNVPDHLGRASLKLRAAAARLADLATLLTEVVSTVVGAEAHLGIDDVCRQHLLSRHGEWSRGADTADTLIADAWDILAVTLEAYNDWVARRPLAGTAAEHPALLPPGGPTHDVYDAAVLRLAEIVSDLLDSLQEYLDVPHLPDSYEIAYLPWRQVREEIIHVALTYQAFACGLRDTDDALRALRHVP